MTCRIIKFTDERDLRLAAANRIIDEQSTAIIKSYLALKLAKEGIINVELIEAALEAIAPRRGARVMGYDPRGPGLFPEPTPWNGDDDRDLGPEPPPCLPQRTIGPGGHCIDCHAPEGECWWDHAPEEDE